MMTTRITWFGLAAFFVLSGFLGAGEAVVIANNNVPETALDAASLKSVLLGKKKKWSNGSKIMLATLKSGDTADDFLKLRVGKTARQFLTYWKKMVFTGKGSMPKLFDNEEDLVRYVNMTDGAIGFVSAETPVADVKTVPVTP